MNHLQTQTPREIFQSINSRIAAACQRAGRDSAEITLIGASKTVEAQRLQKFVAAGLFDIGENYLQEALAKKRELREELAETSPDIEMQFHFIGALQSTKLRKLRDVVANFDFIHSVDRLELVEPINDAARELGKIQNVFVQVNIGDEASKSGCAPGEVSTLSAHVAAQKNLRFCGLMCLPPFSPDAEKTRPFFAQMRKLRDAIAAGSGTALGLSMGMSNDFEIAIEEGATHVRIGTALFGQRG